MQYLLRPQAAGHTWVGRLRARRAPTQLFVRTHGARDLALGLGSLSALGRPAEARRWMLAQALADGVDLAATLRVRDKLASRPRKLAIGVAGASTAVAAAAAALLREQPR